MFLSYMLNHKSLSLTDLVLHWRHAFPEALLTAPHHYVELKGPFTLMGNIMDSSSHFRSYVIDILHLSLHSYKTTCNFWQFLFETTLEMEETMAIDQEDLVSGVLLMAEFLNQASIRLPSVMYDLHLARFEADMACVTTATALVLRRARFETLLVPTTPVDEGLPNVPIDDDGPSLVAPESRAVLEFLQAPPTQHP